MFQLGIPLPKNQVLEKQVLATARIEELVRESYARLLAILAARSGDVALAEDVLADAVEMALKHWPSEGIPHSPNAWLMGVAKNRLTDVWRSSAYKTRSELSLEDLDVFLTSELENDTIPDERLRLLFVCAHPAIDSAAHAPLMLQTVLGLDAEQIAQVYCIPTATMAQRLVRAKRKIKESNISFEMPARSDMANRIESVLDAIYAAYTIAWHEVVDLANHKDLTSESLYLSSLLVQLLSNQAEVLGLAALIHFSCARRAARWDKEGNFVPFDGQNIDLWERPMIDVAERLLRQASVIISSDTSQKIGRFQLEAAVQSVYCSRRRGDELNVKALVHLYTGLIQIAPSLGSLTSYALCVGKLAGPDLGLAALNSLSQDAWNHYQPAWVAKASLLRDADQPEQAKQALQKAIELTTDQALMRYLQNQLLEAAG